MFASFRNRPDASPTTLGGLAAAAAAFASMAVPAAAAADTFPFSGAEQTYIVPAGVTAVHVEATGAAGAAGDPSSGGLPGGRGATVSGTVAASPGQTLYVEVGGVGCNGSGDGEFSDGGGASDVRTITVSDDGGDFCGIHSPSSVGSRLIVAGAGGGGGSLSAGADAGEDAGGGAAGGKAGTDSAGGAGGTANSGNGSAGELGGGGDGPAGGGGGGFYGGGGGGLDFDSTFGFSFGAGGGGSSLVPAGGSGPEITSDPASVEITPCTIVGTAANDKLKGSAGDDAICGLGGNDRINGRGGADSLFGDGGDDRLIGEGGEDALDGGAGSLDTADYRAGSPTENVVVDLAAGGADNDGRGAKDTIANVERVEGAKNQQNSLTGDDGPNKLIGGLLADTLAGGGGADLIRGEDEHAFPTGGADDIAGGDGDDEIFSGPGENTVAGGAGSDTINYGSLGVGDGVFVQLTNGAGTGTVGVGFADDTLSEIENVRGTGVADGIFVAWNGVENLISGRGQDDSISADDGDSIDVLHGGAGDDLCTNTDGDTEISC